MGSRRRHLLVGSLVFLAMSLGIMGSVASNMDPAVTSTAALTVASIAEALVDAPSISLMTDLASARGIGSGESVTASEIAVTVGAAIGPWFGQLCFHHVGLDGLCYSLCAVAFMLGILAAFNLEAGSGRQPEVTDV